MPVTARFNKFLSRRPSHLPDPRASGTSFLSLPPELRNTIYSLVAEDTRLDLWGPRPKLNSRRLPPSLILVSKQVREEYLPLLLATARITVWIRDFHFRPLTRVIASLYPAELDALRVNAQRELVMLVSTDAVANDYARSDIHDMDSLIQPLRRWLAHQANSEDGLNWTYIMALVNRQTHRRPPEFSYMKLSDLLRRLGERVPDALEWELDHICHAGMYTMIGSEEDAKFVPMGRRART